MNTRKQNLVFVKDGVKYTIAGAQPAPKFTSPGLWTKHRGKSDSAAAKATGRHNHS